MRISFFFWILLLAAGSLKATHLQSGYISLKHQSGLTYTVTLRIFTNTGSEIRFGDGLLDFGDGSKPLTTPITEAMATQYPNVGAVLFSTTHTFPSNGFYRISYGEPNLQAGIINITNSVECRFYLESGILVESGKDHSSPDFLVDQFFSQSLGTELAFSNQATDLNDYRLTYTLAVPLQPLTCKYTQPGTLTINNYSGLVKWNTDFPGLPQGQYLFAVRVNQFDDFGNEVGYVMRTFMILLEDINSNLSTSTSISDPNNKVYIGENAQRTIHALISDNAGSDQVKWEAFFDNKIAANVTFTQHDSVAGSKKMKVGLLTLKSTPSIVRDHPYTITLRGTSLNFGRILSNDISYLFFTKDIELPVIITGMNDVPVPGSSVHPNPFSHHVYVDCQSTTDKFDYRLMDITGKVILEEKGVTGKQIDVSRLSAGIYILQIRTGFVVDQHRLIKQ